MSREGAEYTELSAIDRVYVGSYHHQLIVIEVYMQLIKQYPEAVWMSERELLRDKFKKFKMESGQRGHMPDGMLLFLDGRKIAIEVELTMKGSWRLEKILSNYFREFWFKDEVWYFCAPNILSKMRKAAEEYKSVISVFELESLQNSSQASYPIFKIIKEEHVK